MVSYIQNKMLQTHLVTLVRLVFVTFWSCWVLWKAAKSQRAVHPVLFHPDGAIHTLRWLYRLVGNSNCHNSHCSSNAAASLWVDPAWSHYAEAGLMKGMCLLWCFQREMWRKRKAKGLETWWRLDGCWQYLMFGVSSHGYPVKYS